MYSVGVDVHQRCYVGCILGSNGQVFKRFQVRSVDELFGELAKLQGGWQVCYEASCGYGTLYDRMVRLPDVRRVVVAHPGELRLIFRNKQKNDRVDAQKLALLLFLDQVPAAHVPKLAVRDWRALIEFRRKLMDKRVAAKNELRAVLRTHGVEAPHRKAGMWTRKNRPWIEQIELPELSVTRRDLLLEQLDELAAKIAAVTRQLDVIARKDGRIALLRTIPGVGPRSAEAFVAYIDEVKRFTRSKQVGSYFGFVPCQDQSGGKNRLGHITRNGPATVRKLLSEAAWQGVRRSPEIRTFFERITHGKRERRKVALVATAHWLARVMFAMLRTGEISRFTKLPKKAKKDRDAKAVVGGPASPMDPAAQAKPAA